MSVFRKINHCRICGNKNLKEVINLGNQYIQGSFIKKNLPKPFDKKIPLKLVLCSKCTLVQLLHTTNKEILYRNYWYESGINKTMRNHLKQLIKSIIKYKKKQNKNLNVLDIGCNDGTLLSYYPNEFNKYGIDPSQIIEKINKKKINVIRDFFPPKKKSNKLKIQFDFITSIAMFYDLDDPNKFVKKIKYHLTKNGIWIFELSYLIDMLKLNSFDTICHEHLEYYSLHSLNYLMKKHGLKIFEVKKNSINGGSIRCFVTHEDNSNFDKINNHLLIKKMLDHEKKIRISSTYIYKNFFKEITKIKKKLNILIKKIINKNEKIYILGASTKGNTILQFLNIDSKIIQYAVERNKEKIGAKTIGSNIKIISEMEFKKNPSKYQLVLPWHFKSEIIKREKKFLKNNGNLIFPLPKIQILNKKNINKYA